MTNWTFGTGPWLLPCTPARRTPKATPFRIAGLLSCTKLRQDPAVIRDRVSSFCLWFSTLAGADDRENHGQDVCMGYGRWRGPSVALTDLPEQASNLALAR